MNRRNEKDAAALARIQVADQEEAMRGHWWGLLSQIDKARALGVARLDPKRAVDTLSSFTPAERHTLSVAVSAHIAKMELVVKLMGLTCDRPGVDASNLH